MTKSDGNFKLDEKSSKPLLKRVNLPSKVHPVFREIHHHDKLLDIVSDLVNLYGLEHIYFDFFFQICLGYCCCIDRCKNMS